MGICAFSAYANTEMPLPLDRASAVPWMDTELLLDVLPETCFRLPEMRPLFSTAPKVTVVPCLALRPESAISDTPLPTALVLV